MEPHGIVKAFRKVKRAQDIVPATSGVTQKKVKTDEVSKETWLCGVVVHIVQAGIGKARTEIFHKRIIQNGGEVSLAFSPAVTHVILDDEMDCDRALRLLGLEVLPPRLQLVRSAWLSLCIAERRLLSTIGYSIFIPDRYLPSAERNKNQGSGDEDQQETAEVNSRSRTQLKLNCTKIEESFAEQQGEATAEEINGSVQASTAQFCVDEGQSDAKDDIVSEHDLRALISGSSHLSSGSDRRKAAVSGKWVCAQSSKSKKQNHNKPITDKLEVLEAAYTHQGDKWRALGYAKAINSLKRYQKPVSSYEEACKIPGIGKRMAEKIREILESGHLRKLDYISESVPVLETFSNIWGAGVKTAQMWYQQGFRTLDDIQMKASLTKQQIIGLKHYHDFLDRMPREEAGEIEKVVGDMAQSIDPSLIALACGSYRRGRSTCGDVDVLITHPDGKSHQGVFSKILAGLRDTGFLTDDLVSQEESGDQKKYLGVCRLPGPGHRHRRLDIIVVPYSEFACALMYFTGSAHFNRSMRALAKTKGMSLSEHSLNYHVLRKGSAKLTTGVIISTTTEQDIFEHLGLLYRKPHERDW
ncbi:DNA polymerase lambda [Rhincodon typus]|uniref:DNA polymerase lambda n=1 Tax=Rhincodon typus TaxID=259920 RepID=UPI00202E0846|nr:DNA polymerase lambda [Rhincodon typus]